MSRHLVEQRRLIRHEGGLAGQHGNDIAICHLTEEGDQLGPNPVPAEARVVVARIVDRNQADSRAQGGGIGAAQTKEGSPGRTAGP
jgi:hypothetical protein